MGHLTAGQINDKFVRKYLSCIIEEGGNLRNAATSADREHGLNCAASSEEGDSWHEAVARYKKIMGMS